MLSVIWMSRRQAQDQGEGRGSHVHRAQTVTKSRGRKSTRDHSFTVATSPTDGDTASAWPAPRRLGAGGLRAVVGPRRAVRGPTPGYGLYWAGGEEKKKILICPAMCFMWIWLVIFGKHSIDT